MACLAEEAIACALPYDEKFLTIRHLDDLQKKKVCSFLVWTGGFLVEMLKTNKIRSPLQRCQCSSDGLNNWVLLLVADLASAGLFLV